MASEEEKKIYWCDQIKSMIGPCLITFGIPMMIPGFTITFVAFADEDAFPKYGALHVVGILILGIAVILIILGCILKFYWKPFIGIDLEMHLSPNHSFRNIHTDKINSGHLRLEKAKNETTPKHALNPRRNSLPNSLRGSERARIDNIPITDKKSENKSESETEGTGSESDLKKSLTGNSERTFDIMASPRSRNLVPVNSESIDELDQNDLDQNDIDRHFQETESFEALQDWRKKKKKKAKKRLKQTQNEIQEDENIHHSQPKTTQNLSAKEHNETTEDRKPRRKKKKKKILNSLRHEQTQNGKDNSQFIQSLCEPKLSNDTKNDNQDSDHSSVSIGSADSVLAQYTSR